MKPCLKWVGGKTQILDAVLNRFPERMNDYYEPFLGGGSVLLGFLSQRRDRCAGTVYASDINPHLIALYRNIQSRHTSLIVELRRLITDYKSASAAAGTATVTRTPATYEEALTSPESYYYWIRSRFNGLVAQEYPLTVSSAMFLFLNRTCFRGLYREGPRGFNVPYGNYASPFSDDIEEHIESIHRLIQGVVFRCCSWVDALRTAGRGDFVYLDPPYVPVAHDSFVSYTADGFGEESHMKLFTTCHSLVEKGVAILMSNSDTSLVAAQFPAPRYELEKIVCRRAINSKKPGAQANEVLVRGGQLALDV
jgi:DNA adenine methylase